MASMLAIYHEKQFSSMCGQHCLNNLLQGPYFSAGDLAGIAQELDDKERELMFSQGMDTPDALQYIADGSSNVDDMGNFSIQVLNTALNRSHNLELVQDSQALNGFLRDISSDGAENFVASPTSTGAFVLNLSAHWFVIRNLFGEFWEINSTGKTPKRISQFFLSAYLAQLQQEGWSVFMVVGVLPQPLQDFTSMGVRSNWFVLGEDNLESETAQSNPTVAAATTTREAKAKFPGTGNVLSNHASQDFDDDLARAIHLSKQEQQGQVTSSTDPPVAPSALQDEEEDEEALLQQAIEMSMKAGNSDATSNTTMQQAQNQLGPEPGAGEGVTRIQFVFSDGTKLVRRFLDSEPCGVLFSFLTEFSGSPLRSSPSATIDSITLVKSGTVDDNSRITMQDHCTSSLSELGLGSSAKLHVQIQNKS